MAQAPRVLSLPSVSVVVPARNRAHLIPLCLDRLARAAAGPAAQGHAVEFIVVDDASTDGTAAQVQAFAGRCPGIRVRCLSLPKRGGPARARNAAVQVAGGDLVVFVDSDVLVVPEFLRAHLDAHRRYGSRVLVLGTLRTVPSADAAARRPRGSLWDFSTNPLDTANASVMREHLLAAGLFDEGFGEWGWEDLDLGLRLLRLGLRRYRARGAVGYHVKPPVTDRVQLEQLLQKERERSRSASYFLAKHPGLLARLAVQQSSLHRALNWACRMGGRVRADNVLAWMDRARRVGLPGLSQIWLSGVLNHEYLAALRSRPPRAAEQAGN